MDIENLKSDIDDILLNGFISEEQKKEAYNRALPQFLDSCKKALWGLISGVNRRSKDSYNLRPSNLGYPDRKLWYTIHQKNEGKLPMDASTALKFMLGNLSEAVILALVQITGHDVQGFQKRVSYKGVEGSVDAIIDGHLVDVKSASPSSYKNKFQSLGVLRNDPFGYIDQLSFYFKALKEEGIEIKETPYFIPVNKVDGDFSTVELLGCFLSDIDTRINHAKEMLSKDVPPEEFCCSVPSPDKNGNVAIPFDCNFCDYKFSCHKDLKAFRYADGIKYFIHVEKPPRVPDVTEEMNNAKTKREV